MVVKKRDKPFYFEPKLARILDLMVQRMKSKRDVVLLVDGHEGEGKSNIATYICGYVAQQTGRPFSVDNVFFDIADMTKFAKQGKQKIILWDEGALGGLASDWWNKNQKLFVKLLMVARKKQHFFVICIPKFYKLNEYIACDRSIGLVHVYSADNLERGRFTYYNDNKKDLLYDNWKRKHKKTYKYNYNFHGRFPEALPFIIDEDAYEKKKDQAIMDIDKQEEKIDKIKLKLQYGVSLLPTKTNLTGVELSKHLKFGADTLSGWKNLGNKHDFLRELGL